MRRCSTAITGIGNEALTNDHIERHATQSQSADSGFDQGVIVVVGVGLTARMIALYPAAKVNSRRGNDR